MDKSSTLDCKQAYIAMFRFLEEYYDLTKADDIGALLGSMCLTVDGLPRDSSMWQDWLRVVSGVQQDWEEGQRSP